MKNLIWQDNNRGWASDDAGMVFPLSAKPTLSFQFDALYHEPTNEFFVLNGVRTELTDAQINECETFAANSINAAAADIMAVDSRGKYLGLIAANDPKVYKQVTSAPYSNDHMRYDFTTNFFVKIQAVDKNGVFLGNVDLDDPNFYQDVQSVPSCATDVWDFTAKAWKDGRTLAQLQEDLCADIDAFADQCSLKYVTAGVTQSARYQAKLQECQGYRTAGYPNSAAPTTIDSTIYPYIYWEANQTGQTGQQLADNVIAKGSAWAGKGGMLEGYRIGGKKNVMAAATPADAQKAHDVAINDLGLV